MDNPYSSDWENIGRLADSIRKTAEERGRLISQATALRGKAASLPVRRDGDGNDVNENARNAALAQLAAVERELSRVENKLDDMRTGAQKLAAAYRQKAASFQGKQGQAMSAASRLSLLTGKRFGALAARSGMNASRQQGTYYQSHVTELMKLAAAASAAAAGSETGGGPGAIAARGTLQKSEKESGPGTVGGQSADRTGEIGTTAAVATGMAALGLAVGARKPNLSSFAHTSVNMGKESTQNQLDEALAIRLGITPQEALQYRQENGLEWCRNPENGEMQLVCVDAARAASRPEERGSRLTALKALRRYLDQHGYSSVDYGEFSKDPEWQRLYQAAFPEDGEGKGVKNSMGNAAADSPDNGPGHKAEPYRDLLEYMCAHNYGPDDFAVYSKDPEWQRLHQAAFPDYELPGTSRQEAHRDLFEYMCAHNYSKEDAALFTRDPEWRRLYHLAYPDQPIPGDPGEVAFCQLSSYMNAHNYGPGDFAVYSKDLEWQRLHRAAFPKYYRNAVEHHINGFRGISHGGDLTAFVRTGRQRLSMMDMARMQKFTNKPRIAGKDEFQAAVRETGVICFRTWSDGRDVKTGKTMSAKQFKDALFYMDEFCFNGTGQQVYGPGVYLTVNQRATPGKLPEKNALDAARECSMSFAENGHRATACITYHPSMRIINGDELRMKYKALPLMERMSYRKGGISALAVALGYDAALWTGAGGDCDFLTVFNRSKLIVLDDPENKAFDIRS